MPEEAGDPAGMSAHRLGDLDPAVALGGGQGRSTHSVTMLTAVSKPKVKSVTIRSLSMVFGTPTVGRLNSLWSRWAAPRVSSPPIATKASRPNSLKFARAWGGRSQGFLKGWSVKSRGSCPLGDDPVGLIDVEVDGQLPGRVRAHPSRRPTQVPPSFVTRLDDGTDHRVETGAVAAARRQPTFMNRS